MTLHLQVQDIASFLTLEFEVDFFLGIDISKDSFDVCVRTHERVIGSSSFRNNSSGFESLERWMSTKNVDTSRLRVGLEATNVYHLELTQWFYERCLSIYVLNPRAVFHFGKSLSRAHKTDSQDARVIALMLQNRHSMLVSWEPVERDLVELRKLTRAREQQSKRLIVERTHLKAFDSGSVLYEMAQERIELFEKHISNLEKSMLELIKESESLKAKYELLTSVPQIGKLTALTLLAELGHARDFSSVKQLTSWVGLVPSQHRSGTSIMRRGRISKTGNSRIRKALYMASLGCFREGSPWKPWVDKKNQSGKSLNVAMMDKLLRTCWGVLKTGRRFDAKLAIPA